MDIPLWLTIILQILLQLVLIMLNAIFACAEIAVIETKGTKLDSLAESGNKKARRLKKQKNTEIQINPIIEDPDATKIELPEPETEKSLEEENPADSEENKKNIKTGKKLNVVTEE